VPFGAHGTRSSIVLWAISRGPEALRTVARGDQELGHALDERSRAADVACWGHRAGQLLSAMTVASMRAGGRDELAGAAQE